MLTLLRQGQAAIKRRFGRLSQSMMLMLSLSFACAAVMTPATALAQNDGKTAAFGQAVQGQSAAQPEGAFLNAMNWLGNVICPIAAAGTLAATIIQYRAGRGWVPSLVTTGGLLGVSGGIRLLEYFVTNGQQVG